MLEDKVGDVPQGAASKAGAAPDGAPGDLPRMEATTPRRLSFGERRDLFNRYVNMLFVDHAVFRLVYSNMHRISANMYRSSQPTPGHIARAARMGIKTIINLRGRREDCGSWVLEDKACREYGVTLVDFPVNSRDAPKKHNLHAARDIWNRIEYPALMHCKAGSDRVGFMSVLYLFIHEGVPLDQALKQLSLKYGHVRQAKTGILDHFYESYLAYDRETPTDFYTWVDEVYDPPKMKAEFLSTWWANTITDGVLKRE